MDACRVSHCERGGVGVHGVAERARLVAVDSVTLDGFARRAARRVIEAIRKDLPEYCYACGLHGYRMNVETHVHMSPEIRSLADVGNYVDANEYVNDALNELRGFHGSPYEYWLLFPRVEEFVDNAIRSGHLR